MREQELEQIEENVRSMEQTNLNITQKLNAAHVANNTTYTWELFVSLFLPRPSSSLRLNRSTFITELFPDDIPTNLADNALLAVDLGQLTIRSEGGDRTFQELLSEFSSGDTGNILSLT